MYKSHNSKCPERVVVDTTEYTYLQDPETRLATVLEDKYNLPLSRYTGVLRDGWVRLLIPPARNLVSMIA